MNLRLIPGAGGVQCVARLAGPSGVMPVVPYNQRDVNDPLDIEYRVEDTIAVSEERLDEAYRKRSRIETAIGSL